MEGSADASALAGTTAAHATHCVAGEVAQHYEAP